MARMQSNIAMRPPSWVNAMVAGPRGVNALWGYWAVLAVSIGCSNLSRFAGESLGPILPIVVLGATACGWSWLASRALFRPVERAAAADHGADASHAWPLAIVLAMSAVHAVLVLIAGPTADPTTHPEIFGAVLRGLYNFLMLASSAMLVLVVVEALNGYGRSSKGERRFRAIFLAVYASLVGVSSLWLSRAAEGTLPSEIADIVRGGLGVVAIVLFAGAIRFRVRHPLAPPAAAAPLRRRRSADLAPVRTLAPASSPSPLARNILKVVEQESFYSQPNLKVADLTAHADAPEYKVTQCITGELGYLNFNRLVNRYRLEEAQRRLSDPAYDDCAILVIAMDCGFGSVGPFNRAFKELVGVTPTAFRSARRLSAAAALTPVPPLTPRPVTSVGVADQNSCSSN